MIVCGSITDKITEIESSGLLQCLPVQKRLHINTILVCLKKDTYVTLYHGHGKPQQQVLPCQAILKLGYEYVGWWNALLLPRHTFSWTRHTMDETGSTLLGNTQVWVSIGRMMECLSIGRMVDASHLTTSHFFVDTAYYGDRFSSVRKYK